MLVQKTHKHTPHIFQCVPFAFYDLWFMDSTIYLSRLKVTFLFMHSKICDTPSHLKHSFFRFASFRCAHRTCVIFNEFFPLKQFYAHAAFHMHISYQQCVHFMELSTVVVVFVLKKNIRRNMCSTMCKKNDFKTHFRLKKKVSKI